MEAISDRRVHTIVVKSSAQVGKTEMLLNIAGYFIHQDPSPMLFLQPTVAMAQAFSKDRLTPMCRDTPVLAQRLTTLRGADGASAAVKKGSTLLQKVFPGGHISLAGMNAASELASRPVRVVLIDEVDRAPLNVGGAESGEGDPVSLARKRSQTFWNKKTILVSTPTIEGMSRIDDEFQESDKREYRVPCPHCGHQQKLEWKQVTWPKDEPARAQYCCAECGTLWTDAERWHAVSKGYWVPTQLSQAGIAGFHISEIYSPWSKLGDMATNFVIAKRGGPEQLKTWVNTALGECWNDDEGDTVDWETLWRRREHYKHGYEVPDQVHTIVAGVDVQDDRIEYEVIGYGAGEESWSLQYRILIGSPGRAEVWQALADELWRPFYKDDLMMNVRMVCIDSGGHFTDEVYSWCRKQGVNWAVPVKGSSEYGKPVATHPRKRNKDHKVYLTMVGTDTAKQTIYDRFRNVEPGPGYTHFPVADEYDENYFTQSTAEKRIRKYRKGVAYFEWDAGHRRNEALDCKVYALAAIRILQQNYGVRLDKPHKRKDGPGDETEAPISSASKRDSRRGKRQKRPGSGWVNYEGKWT